MYRKGDLVEVRDYDLKTKTTHGTSQWVARWAPGIVIECLGKTKMRTGIARFQTLEAVLVLVNGKVRKVSTNHLRYLRD